MLQDERPRLTFFTQQVHKYRTVEPYTRYATVIDRLSVEMYSFFSILKSDNFYLQPYDPDVFFPLLIKADIQGFKPLCLSKELFNAFQQSKIPDSISEFKRVIPCGLLFVPPGLEVNGDAVISILFSHELPGEYTQTIYFSDGSELWGTTRDNSCINYIAITKKYILSGLLPFSNISETTSEDFEFTQNVVNVYSEKKKIDLVQKQGLLIRNILLQTLLYLQTKPDELQQVVVPVQTRTKGSASWHKPTLPIIGKDYKIKRETTKTVSSNPGNPTGIKVATHWRRGHYRHQAIGSRENLEHKLIWIEPVLVNG